MTYLYDGRSLTNEANRASLADGDSAAGPTSVYTQRMFEESLAINTLGVALLALAVVVPLVVLYPKFRFRPQRVITVTTTTTSAALPTDRYN